VQGREKSCRSRQTQPDTRIRPRSRLAREALERLTANIARYHRKALPKKKHDTLHGLSPEDITLIARLGEILRLVEDLHCELDEKVLRVALEGAEDLSVELYGASLNGDLFEKAFDRRIVLEKTES